MSSLVFFKQQQPYFLYLFNFVNGMISFVCFYVCIFCMFEYWTEKKNPKKLSKKDSDLKCESLKTKNKKQKKHQKREKILDTQAYTENDPKIE